MLSSLRFLQDHGLCGERIDFQFSLIEKKSRPGLVMVRHVGFLSSDFITILA